MHVAADRAQLVLVDNQNAGGGRLRRQTVSDNCAELRRLGIRARETTAVRDPDTAASRRTEVSQFELVRVDVRISDRHGVAE